MVISLHITSCRRNPRPTERTVDEGSEFSNTSAMLADSHSATGQ
jgi:hypothetical protein